MKYINRILAFFIALVIVTVPLLPESSAVFDGDDKVVVVLDPGHGGNDPGSIGINYEAYYNLQVALAAKARLEENGNFVVHMTRSTPNETLTIAQRLYYADTVNADVAISIHFNSSATSNMGGVEVYGSVLDKFFLGELAQDISAGVAAAAGISNRGVFRKYDYGSPLYYWSEEYQWDIPADSSVGGLSDYYGVITWAAKFGFPSLIIEHAYLSNTNERTLVEDPAILKAMGEADADAIINYYTNHTHSYGSEVIDAPVTCFSAGKKSVHCTVCGHRKNVTSVAAAPDTSKHIWLKDEETGSVEPTCETDGYTKYYCRYTHNLNEKGCEQFAVHRTEDVTPAYGHNYEVTYQQAVTHTVDGITTYTCSRCNKSYNETVAAEGHSFSLVEHKDPECTVDGYDKYACAKCEEVYSDPIPMLGHAFTVTDSLAPTCEADGYENKVCGTCAHEEKNVLPATGHDNVLYSDVLPNCIEEGLRITKCNNCGKMEETVLEKTDHSFATAAELAPTCEEKGEILNRCIVCSLEETVILDATGHDYEVVEEVNPTCEGEGSVTHRCRICSKETIDTVSAIGHAFDEGKVIKEPGLLFQGRSEHICLNDQAHITELPVRDLTVFEYRELYPARFAALIAGVILFIAGAVLVIVIIMIKRHRPSHAKPKAKKEAPTVSEAETNDIPEVELETEAEAAETEKVK